VSTQPTQTRGRIELRPKCDRCRGTGIYSWGSSVNGVMQHSGVCFHCKGKGWQTKDDEKRNAAYMNYAWGRF
jgi:DnaJ-class molecular chaperone